MKVYTYPRAVIQEFFTSFGTIQTKFNGNSLVPTMSEAGVDQSMHVPQTRDEMQQQRQKHRQSRAPKLMMMVMKILTTSTFGHVRAVSVDGKGEKV